MRKCTDGPCYDPAVLNLETSSCGAYHIFVARGSDSPKPGHQGELIRLVCDGLNATCGYENIDYPANSSWAGKEAWCLSAAKGAKGGQQQMTDYARRCPDAKLILFGFSQGGSVGMDILGGGGGPVFECVQAENPPLNRTTIPGSNIAGALLFGAVKRAKGQSFSLKGGENYSGQFPRNGTQLEALNEYADIIRDYCNTGDFLCAYGTEPASLERHLDYFDLYNDEAADWMVKTAKKELRKNAPVSAQNGGSGNGKGNGNANGGGGTSEGERLGTGIVMGVVVGSVVVGLLW
ncbi:Alpha/Beta hydrolase protein [Dendryphion nanum]|uniref:Alpha/Beta hydrolase protein n=1 Tax=Dendryphion nanum TaxID=256645 RepID=A0A9P9DS30_9PLEO|nr:Alpha/Beta hydrolase protein [Dendryphion nanum]